MSRGSAREPRVVTIPFGVPFLPTLVASLAEGQLINGFQCADDPIALADVTLYLPTRRSARKIRSVFRDYAKGATFLPRIIALSDLGDEAPFAGADGDLSADGETPPGDLERLLVLTQHILDWTKELERAFPDRAGQKPSGAGSPAEAAHMARALAKLIDEVRSEEGDWSRLDAVTPEDLASHFAVTKAFLQVASKQWPEFLSQAGTIDPGVQRDAMIRREAERLRTVGSAGPVIAAGSTGSVPATAELLTAISQLPNGAVVLPGLDIFLDEPGWQAIGDREQAALDPALATHPQYGLKALLKALGVRREDVVALRQPEPEMAERAHLVAQAMRPVSTLEAWSGASSTAPNISILEAPNEREEATTIALILRQNFEVEGKTSALITPDRTLARRVAVELARWNLKVEDAAGTPILRTPPGIAATLALQAVLLGFQARSLLAWLKHGLVTITRTSVETTSSARCLERAVLRGLSLPIGLGSIRTAFDDARDHFERRESGETGVSITNAARTLSRDEWDQADELLEALAVVARPFEQLLEEPASHSLGDWISAHLAILEKTLIVSEADASDAHAAKRLLGRMAEISDLAIARGLPLSASDYPDFFEALFQNELVRRSEEDAPIQILGVLEARLQSFDEVILAGLNEGTWPANTRSDPFLSRLMGSEVGLEVPERLVGLAAHDFTQGIGQPSVWLTRSAKSDGQPQIPSRWLQRFSTFVGPEVLLSLQEPGRVLLKLAAALDTSVQDLRFNSSRPTPSPPVHLRPKKLSVTEIETLIRDPYAIYARHILELRALEQIASAPGPAERGILFHEILERFVREYPGGPFDEQAHARLIVLGRESFRRFRDYPAVQTLWWPRFMQMAEWFVTTEESIESVVERQVECSGAWPVSNQFSLSGRADRIDRTTDGKLRIVDYKTGQPPSGRQVLNIAPQLLLEALMIEAGAFAPITGEVASADYYKLSSSFSIESRGTQKGGKDRPEISIRDALSATRDRLDRLIAHYASPSAVYQSQAIPVSGRVFIGDYDHLARVAEWLLLEDAA